MDFRKQKHESRHRLFTSKKINSKQITDITVKHKAIKILEGNIGENLDESVFCKDFANTKAQSMKKIDKMDFIKIKNACSAEDTVNRNNTSQKMGENICKR